jgi:hypothetical protein
MTRNMIDYTSPVFAISLMRFANSDIFTQRLGAPGGSFLVRIAVNSPSSSMA